MYSVEVVADDLTGAMDTSQGFAARGYATTVVADPDAVPSGGDAAVLGINTDSRYDDAADAADAVAGAIEATPARMVYKKVDSTLRGNFAAEVDAALAAAGAELAVVAPAFPSAGRTTEDGVHYVKGTPVADTEYGDDEKGPASSSIADLFASVDRPVATVPLSVIEAGGDRLADELADAVEGTERAPVVICDAVDDDHLAAIAGATSELDAVYVGSGGLAEHIAVPDADAREPSPPRPATGAALGVAGSVSATTLAQLARVPDEAVVEIDAGSLLEGGAASAAVDRAVERLRAGRPVVLTAATDGDTVERTLATGREQGLTDAEIRDRVADGLATAASNVLDEESPSGLLLTGGDVAVAAIRELGATAVTLTGAEVEAGIPIGAVADGDVAGTPLVTKAGGFGSEETIVNCLDALSRSDAQ